MHITIVGGGFGGVRSALELAKNPKIHVTLITDKPNFQYYPTLYSTATGHSHLETWVPLGEIFADHTNVHVYIDKIVKINAKNQILIGDSGATYNYDTVIFALGVVTTYYGIAGLETYALGIKSEAEIRKLKQRLFIDIAEKHEVDKNYVVIGAGPTGVELSAAIGTYIRRLCKHYHVKNPKIRVRLIEAAPRILPHSSVTTSKAAARRLKSLGIKVEVGKRVERENAKQVIISGKTIESHTVIWTAGVCNNPFFGKHSDIFTLEPNGRVKVDEYLKASKNIYVIGDNAATPYTGLAQTALHDARTVAKNLRRQLAGKKPRVYKPVLPVQVIPIGRHWAVVEWRWIKFHGWLGGLVRRFANLLGYSEVFPLGTSLGAWRAAKVYENDYFTPIIRTPKHRR